jgi:hypothetical protein
MKVHFMLFAIVVLTSSIAFGQGNQGFSNLYAINHNAINQNATGLAANLISSESSIFKPVYEIESFARTKPVYDISILSRNIKPIHYVSQHAFLPARFSYTMAVLRPTFNLSQRDDQLNARFIYSAVITKPISNVSAYSAIKPFYDIGQYSRINPYTLSLMMKPN